MSLLLWSNAIAQAISLVPGPPIQIGRPQSQVAVVDLNRDGIPDLLIGASPLVTRIGLGNGTFAPGTTVPSTSGRFLVADFNRDGNADLVTGGRLYLGNGDGTFGAGQALSADAAADIDGDGCPDAILAANGEFRTSPAQVYVFRGNCDGTFRAAVVTSVEDETEEVFITGIAAGDFDGDGRDDVAIAFTRVVYVYPGQGDGHVGAARETGIHLTGIADVGLGGGKVLVTDVNHDGKPDLVAATRQVPSGYMRIALGNGDGAFRAAPAPIWDGWSVNGLTAADLDGNGVTDFALVGCLVSNCDPDDRLYVFPGLAVGYGVPSNYPSAAIPTDVATGDFNGDGRPDVVVTTQGTEVLMFLSAALGPAPTTAVVPAVRTPGLAILFLVLLVAGALSLHRPRKHK